jgi:hypothetical protein
MSGFMSGKYRHVPDSNRPGGIAPATACSKTIPGFRGANARTVIQSLHLRFPLPPPTCYSGRHIHRSTRVKREARKAAISAYTERSVAAGIYAVRCAASGECRVGRAPDLSTIRNRLWFALRQGSNPHRALKAAWRAHGAEAFSFEVVEQLDDEDVADARERRLKDRLAHRAGEPDAAAI